MASRPERSVNEAVCRGAWGEERAAEYLRAHGYEILERNARPFARDGRLEIDIVAYDRAGDALVFVEVKQHRAHSPFQRRLRAVSKRKLACLRPAFNAWRRHNRWTTGYRFDVIQVYGVPGMRHPEIDHIENVGIFVPRERFVRW